MFYQSRKKQLISLLLLLAISLFSCGGEGLDETTNQNEGPLYTRAPSDTTTDPGDTTSFSEDSTTITTPTTEEPAVSIVEEDEEGSRFGEFIPFN